MTSNNIIETFETLDESRVLEEINEEISSFSVSKEDIIENYSEKITFLRNLGGKLKHYQLSNALDFLRAEYTAEFTDTIPRTLTSKFGVVESITNFGKKRSILAACLVSYSDNLNLKFEIEKARGRTMFCDAFEYPPSSISDFARTTLLIVSPGKVLGWRIEMEELGMKYVCVEGKTNFDDIVKKNKGVPPVVLVCSVNIYRKFVDNPANSSKIWRRVVFAAEERCSFYSGRAFSSNLKSSFFWTIFSSYGHSFKNTNHFILNKADIFIVEAGQAEEYLQYTPRVFKMKILHKQSDIPKIYGTDSVISYIQNKSVSTESRVNCIKENINKDIQEECVICNGENFSKCIMLCCLQICCISCLGKHIRSSNNNSDSFSCMFCRAKSSTKSSVVSVKTTLIEEPVEVHPIYSMINKVLLEKILIITPHKERTAEISSFYPNSITFDALNTYRKLSKIQEKILDEDSCLIVLSKTEFYKIHFHKIFSTIAVVVNLSEQAGTAIFKNFVNPGRDPVQLLNIYDFGVEN